MKKGLGLFPSAFPIYFISYISYIRQLQFLSSLQLPSIIVGQDKIKAIISKFSPSRLHIIFQVPYLRYIFFLMLSKPSYDIHQVRPSSAFNFADTNYAHGKGLCCQDIMTWEPRAESEDFPF